MIRAALDRAGVDAEEAVLIGDTRYDVEAAARAGVPTIALRCGGSTDEELRGAIAVYDDPRALLEAFDGSPLGAPRRA